MERLLLFLMLLFAVALAATPAMAQQVGESVETEALVWSSTNGTTSAENNVGAWVLTGSGVASFGVGLTLVLVAHGEYGELSDPVRDAEGRIRGITQREVAKEEQQISDRVQTGSILMGVGALVSVGGILWIMLDGPDESRSTPFDGSSIQPFGWHSGVGIEDSPVGLIYSGRF